MAHQHQAQRLILSGRLGASGPHARDHAQEASNKTESELVNVVNARASLLRLDHAQWMWIVVLTEILLVLISTISVLNMRARDAVWTKFIHHGCRKIVKPHVDSVLV